METLDMRSARFLIEAAPVGRLALAHASPALKWKVLHPETWRKVLRGCTIDAKRHHDMLKAIADGYVEPGARCRPFLAMILWYIVKDMDPMELMRFAMTMPDPTLIDEAMDCPMARAA